MRETGLMRGFGRTASRGGAAPSPVVLVAGGAGFIGAWLCARLIKDGARVICVDNLLTGSRERLAGLLTHPNFEFRLHDIIDPLSVAGPLDQIYNLACAASPPAYQRDPLHTFRTNVIGVMNLLDLARAKGARFLQASTSEVYGDPTVSPQAESYTGNVNTHGPRACYDEGKRAAETLCHDYHQQHGVETRIARIFNTYGPGMSVSDGRVVPAFILQALCGEPVTVYGDGSQTRSFCYVDDLVVGLERLMTLQNVSGKPVNLGNTQELTVSELAEMILAKTDSASKIIYHGLPPDDPMRRKPDISRARDVLGWEPLVPLSVGLDHTIAAFRGIQVQAQARVA